jgi:hypothetical protein
MKLNTGSAGLLALILAAVVLAPAAVMADTKAEPPQAQKANADQAIETAVTELRKLHRERAEREQAEAARRVADAVLSAAKLDLDMRRIGPISISGDF